MSFADLADVNVHLPEDKITIDAARYAPLELDAERIVRGFLSGYIDSAVMALWVDPDHTPEIIRAITGRFVAAFYYRERYSEDSLEDPVYAQTKYNEAMELLRGIIGGVVAIPEVDVAGGEHMEEEDFYPNDKAYGPVFRIDPLAQAQDRRRTWFIFDG